MSDRLVASTMLIVASREQADALDAIEDAEEALARALQTAKDARARLQAATSLLEQVCRSYATLAAA